MAKPIDASKWNPEQDEWGLYDTRSDFNLMNNVAKEQPEKLKQMKALFMEEAVENKVLPIGGGLHSILNPQDMPKTTNTKWRLFEGMTRIPESEAPNVHTGNVKAVITADVPNDKINGVLWAIGGYAGGVSLVHKDITKNRISLYSLIFIVPRKFDYVFCFSMRWMGFYTTSTVRFSSGATTVRSAPCQRESFKLICI